MSSETGLRAAKKEQTRRTIATAALELFLARGFEDVSIAEIAEAAHVSKMTVFNYFPAKEDMFFEFTHGTMPDLAGAVRERRPGESPIRSLRRFVRAELERRAEWSGLHDGVADFSRLIFSSPTLLAGFGRVWQECENELAAVFAEAAGIPRPQSDPGEQLFAALATREKPVADARLASPTSDAVVLRVAVAQVIAALQNLILVNQLRQSLGMSVDETAETALAECDAVFELLESGLGSYGLPRKGSAPEK